MKRVIPLILDTWAVVALALWLGGLAAIWLVLIPAARAVPGDALPAAHAIFGQTLRRFSAVVEVCGLILAAMQWVLRRRYERDKTLFIVDGARMLVVFVALFCAEYGRYVLIPTLLKTGAHAAQTTLAALAIVQAVLLIGYAAVTAWLQMSRLTSAAPGTLRSPGSLPAQRAHRTEPTDRNDGTNGIPPGAVRPPRRAAKRRQGR